MDIRCRKTDCKYNEGLTCLVNELNINDKNNCKEYIKGKEKIDISKQIFSDTPPEIKDYRRVKDMNLHCSAECLFNRQGKCIANGITINDVQNQAKCITHIEE
jgi:hypothetical protein